MNGLLSVGYESLRDLFAFGYRNSYWMGWNLLLAWIPVALGLAIFRRGQRRSLVWWSGAGLFALFLPNAPYVATDLIHLRWAVVWADSDREVLTAVLPVFAVFVAAGYLAYYLCLRMLNGHLARAGVSGNVRWASTMVIHAVCAVGVVLGRFARLNSWEPVTEPRNTLETIVVTLTWERAPAALLLTFGTIWLGYTLTAAVMDAVVIPTGRAIQTRLGLVAPPRPASYS
jgi:uncharacterized membrane protein